MPPEESSGKWIDITVTLHNGMVCWPDNLPFQIRRKSDMAQGEMYNLSEVSLGVHTGTHMDAPAHFVREGKSIDQIPLDIVVGRVRVIEIKDGESIKPEELKQHNIQRGERILFKTRNSSKAWKTDDFATDAVYVSTEAGHFLAERGVKLVGIDYLSVAGYEVNAIEVHQALLAGGVWLLEGLDLSQVEPGWCDLFCLPLKIAGSEAAPARAILKPVK